MAKKRKENRPFSAQSAQAHSKKYTFDRHLARYNAKQLGLHKGDLPNSIKEIIATLNEAGFEAYIVGGGVRDALLGLQPKDFDAVTNATPNQIKEVFGKRCRIIGRRFLLCHVYSGRDMIEVATFRAPPKDTSHLTEDGMIMRDNVWGDIFQDVVRRDFSINAMYYQPLEGFVYDFCGGLNDIKNRTLRLLGDTERRVEEDPVRLLRALRFKAKLGFDFDEALEQQFNPKNWALLNQVSPHRLYDETQKMFTGGYLTPLLPLLFDYQAFEHLLFYPPKLITPLVEQVTVNTDKRIGQGKSINPAFFYASLLWENYLYLLDKYKKNTPFADAQIQAANKVMDKQRVITAMPKFAEQFIKDVWLMQSRLANPRKKNLAKLFENPRFRAGFDFLLMREQVEAKNHALAKTHGEPITLDNESTNGMGHWWAWFQTLNAKQQQKAIDEFDINAVRLRFANFVQAEPSEPHVDGGSEGGNARERRRQKRGKTSYLTEQEQLEKDQLQQLSLANTSADTSTSPLPLWGTPFNHQAAETQTIAPRSLKREVKHEQPKKTAQLDDEATNYRRKKSFENKPLSSEKQANQAPTTRKRRVPSSSLSVLERRQLAEDALENGENTQSDILTIKNEKQPTEILVETPIPKKRTRKPKVAVEQVSEPVVGKAVENTPKNTSATAETLEPKTQKPPTKRTRKKAVASETVEVKSVENKTAEKPPAKRGRKPKVVAENAEVLSVETDINTETLASKPPVKRTRKKKIVE